MSYHISPRFPNELKPCSTTPDQCAFKNAEHFDSLEDGYAFIAQRDGFSTFSSMSSARSTVKFQELGEVRGYSQGTGADLQSVIDNSRAWTEANLTTDELTAMRGYGGFAAGIANMVALGRSYDYYDDAEPWVESDGPTDFYSREELLSFYEAVDSALDKAPRQERILYRGTPIYKQVHKELEESLGRKFSPADEDSLREALLKRYAIGELVSHPHYLSTSSDPEVAAERTDNLADTAVSAYDKPPAHLGILWELKSSRGLDISGIAKKHYAREREVVLPRESSFRIVSVNVFPESYETSENSYKTMAAVIQLEEVDSPRERRSPEQVLRDATM